MRQPSVLMVTGAYDPEVSGASLQCRALIRALGHRVSCMVLTTSADPTLPARDDIDGVAVYRIHVRVERVWSKGWAAMRMVWLTLRLRHRFDLLHLHGFSQKSRLLVVLAWLLRKRVIIKLTSVGHDDPVAIRGRGRFDFWCYTHADALVGVSPQFEVLLRAAGLSPAKYALIPNGVDLERFRPVTPDERRALKRSLGLSPDRAWFLFVGFFSREKCPDVLFDAWLRLQRDGWPGIGLLFVGATRGRYYEIDPTLSAAIRTQAARRGLTRQLVFVEETREVEKYYQAADCFVLPSVREGLPNVLLEAMASGLPCVATRLRGVTDTVITDGVNGLLVPPRDAGALEQILRLLLEEPERAKALGQRARQTVEDEYSLVRTAECYLRLYQAKLGHPRARGC